MEGNEGGRGNLAPTSFHTCGVGNLCAVAIKQDTMRHLRKAVALRVLWIQWRAQRTFEQNRKVRTAGLWRSSASGLEIGHGLASRGAGRRRDLRPSRLEVGHSLL